MFDDGVFHIAGRGDYPVGEISPAILPNAGVAGGTRDPVTPPVLSPHPSPTALGGATQQTLKQCRASANQRSERRATRREHLLNPIPSVARDIGWMIVSL